MNLSDRFLWCGAAGVGVGHGLTRLLCVLATAFALATSAVLAAAADDWEPFAASEWERTHCESDPEAHAEVLLKRITQTEQGRDVYLRVRVYDEKGVKDFAKIDIEQPNGSRVRDIAARTLKPDGTVLELDRRDVYQREVVKARGRRVKVQSFAPPGLEPGVVMEYRFRWRTDRPSYIAVMPFQDRWPVRRCEYAVKMPPIGGWARVIFLNRDPTPIEPDRGGWIRFSMDDLPAREDEPFAPDFEGAGALAILYLTFNGDVQPDKYWKDVSADLASDGKRLSRGTKRVKQAIAEILDGSESVDERLLKLYEFCQAELLNLQRDTPASAQVRSDDPPRIESVDDVLKHRMGNDALITQTFVALANAAGLDVRLGLVADRERFPVSRNIPEKFLLPRLIAAVRLPDGWILADPGTTYLPLGMLSANNTFTVACIGDAKSEVMIVSPNPSAHRSVRRRTANLNLTENGDLEGTVVESLSGYWAQEWLLAHEDKSAGEDRQALQEELRESLAGAEVSELTVSGKADPRQPLVLNYRLRVPGFAERTGSRLFLAPAVFQRGRQPLFTAESRRSRILFNRPASELDEIVITFPESFELEAPAAPGRVESSGIGTHEVELKVRTKAREILLTRVWMLENVAYQPDDYPILKQVFENLQTQDNHTLTLKRRSDL